MRETATGHRSHTDGLVRQPSCALVRQSSDTESGRYAKRCGTPCVPTAKSCCGTKPIGFRRAYRLGLEGLGAASNDRSCRRQPAPLPRNDLPLADTDPVLCKRSASLRGSSTSTTTPNCTRVSGAAREVPLGNPEHRRQQRRQN